MRMPFGKFRGEPVRDLPEWYLRWCLDNVKLSDQLREEMREAVARFSPDAALREALEVQLKAWYRRMTQRHHPDHGGSDAAQAIINDCYESLRELIDGLGGPTS